MYEVIVVGSGATGGWVAKEMAERGYQVLVLEAGEEVPIEEDIGDHHVQQRCRVYNRHTAKLFVDDHLQPYQTSAPFAWIRTRGVGGRMSLWGGQVYRLSDFDFQAATRDGLGCDWPLTATDLSPYYEHVERFLGVTGEEDRLEQVPDSIYCRGRPLRSSIEQHLKQCVEAEGAQLITARLAEGKEEPRRGPCPHCGRISANCYHFVTPQETTLAAAQRTGRVFLACSQQVERLLVDAEGKVYGVAGIDRRQRTTFSLSASLIFLCASTLESTRILLNTWGSRGVLGKYLTVHLYGISVIGQLRLLADHPLTETRLLTIPRWQNLTQETHPLFDRGYACLLTLLPLDRAGEEMPGCFHPQSRGPGQAGRYILACSPFGEAIPDRNNYVEIAPGGVCDAWGGSILRIHYRYSDRDQAMATDMLQTATQLIKRAGGYVIRRQEALTEPGLCIHEAGTCRMGADPATSVLNAYNQCHAAPTVFVVDGSAFPSLPAQNPTLTMMALAVRACDYAHHQIQNGTLSLSERTP